MFQNLWIIFDEKKRLKNIIGNIEQVDITIIDVESIWLNAVLSVLDLKLKFYGVL